MKHLQLLLLFLAILTASACGTKEKAGWDEKEYGGAAPVQKKEIAVYRSETCGCCKSWIAHLQKHGFVVKDHVEKDMGAIKTKYGVSKEMASCHTAIVDGYVIEGHVPAQDIVAMLENKPNIQGLSVPAMPVGTPGMEDPATGRKDPFSVMSFSRAGNQVHRRYETY